MAMRVRVCRVDEVAPGEMKGFEVQPVAVPILVANVDGRLYACSSMCPHEDVSLLGGGLSGTRVTCPGHAYEFDLATGRCGHDRALMLFRYETEVVDDELYVDIVKR
jgi:nitrite reductase/ring-hydroxylating ferredoxin subunit